MFGEELIDTPRAGRPGAEGLASGGGNPLFASGRSDLSEPGGEGGLNTARYTQSDASQPQSARSRLDSARGGLRSNPAFQAGAAGAAAEAALAEEEEFADAGANPLFESARSGGTDLMLTADSDLPLDSARTYDTARSAAATSTAAPSSNPLFGTAEGSAGADAQNPLFDTTGSKRSKGSKGSKGGRKK
jgi:hypothetical protein